MDVGVASGASSSRSRSVDLLPADLQLHFHDSRHSFVAPKYVRLAMGGSHSVYILMRINLHRIGQMLFHYANRLKAEVPQTAVDEDHQMLENAEISPEVDVSCAGELWVCRQHER